MLFLPIHNPCPPNTCVFKISELIWKQKKIITFIERKHPMYIGRAMIHLPFHAFFWLNRILSPSLLRKFFSCAHIEVLQTKQGSVIPQTMFLLGYYLPRRLLLIFWHTCHQLVEKKPPSLNGSLISLAQWKLYEPQWITTVASLILFLPCIHLKGLLYKYRTSR